jgi:hypothetical protein
LFGVIRPVGNKISSNISNDEWDAILNDPTTESSFKNMYGIDHFFYIIGTVLKPLNINRIKFVSNLMWLTAEGDEYTLKDNPITAKLNFYTPSIKYFTRNIDRPKMPIWYIAAFPDINLWLNNDDIDFEYAHEKIYEDITEQDMEELGDSGFNSIKGTRIIKRMVLNYLKNIKPYLEVQTSPVKIDIVLRNYER